MASIRIYQANRRSFAAPRPFVQMLSPGQIVHATYISPAPPHRRPYGPCVCGEPPGAPRLGCGVQRGSEAPQSQQRGSRLPGPAAPLRACHAAAETDVLAASTLVCVRGNDNLLQAPRPVGWMVPKTGSAAGRRGRVLPAGLGAHNCCIHCLTLFEAVIVISLPCFIISPPRPINPYQCESEGICLPEILKPQNGREANEQ